MIYMYIVVLRYITLSFTLKCSLFNILPVTMLPMSRETNEMSLVFRGFRGLLVFRLFAELYFLLYFLYKLLYLIVI